MLALLVAEQQKIVPLEVQDFLEQRIEEELEYSSGSSKARD
jgi:hypothetical protein